MTARVVDASVVAAAFFDEEFAEPARQLLSSDLELLAPDLIASEVANVIWKRFRKREINASESRDLLADFHLLPLRLAPSTGLVASALELALQLDRSIYDCLYFALALRTKSLLVSADRRFVNALTPGPMARHIRWIGEA
jgi:predicted nucleic acid-binding protein